MFPFGFIYHDDSLSSKIVSMFIYGLRDFFKNCTGMCVCVYIFIDLHIYLYVYGYIYIDI